MKYKTLKSIFHEFDEKKMLEEYSIRINSPSTFLLDIDINPIVDGSMYYKEEFPLFFTITKELSMKQEKLLNNSRIIDNALNSTHPSVKSKYFNELLIDELQSTNEIENVVSTKKEIAEALNSEDKKFTKFKGLVDQYKLLELDGKNSIKIDKINDIRNIYDNLVSKEVHENDSLDGEVFRKNFVGVQNISDGKYVHVGVQPETKIIEEMTKMISFIKYFEAPASFKILASHFIFEYIHPFYDGNGRVGRFIIAKLLSDYYDNYTALTFSYVINRNKEKYYKAFSNSSNKYNRGDLTAFIDTMLELLLEGQEKLISDILPKVRIEKNLTKEFISSGKYSEKEGFFLLLLSIDKIFGNKRNRFSLKDIEGLLGIGRVKLNGIVKKHEEHLIKVKGNPVIYEISDDFINVIKDS